MLDIGWSELLVIAIVLIVVVGPKDLPPMIRAFGKTMAGLRKMAGDFRSQFDEALKEADMDDVRQTISDVRNLNPTNSLRDAMNPLRQLGNDIRSDLQNAATPPGSPATSAPVGAPAVSLDEPEMKLPDSPPPAVAAVSPVAAAPAASTAPVAAESPLAEKPKRARKAAAPKSAQEIEAEAVAVKPKRAAKTVAAKADTPKPVRATKTTPKASEPVSVSDVVVKTTRAKASKAVAATEAAPRKTARAKAETAASTPKTAKPAKAKKDEA